jgi:hypothetical protein
MSRAYTEQEKDIATRLAQRVIEMCNGHDTGVVKLALAAVLLDVRQHEMKDMTEAAKESGK